MTNNLTKEYGKKNRYGRLFIMSAVSAVMRVSYIF